MKILWTLLLLLLYATPILADQALVLTEIEQIQEKIWYLQRDVATQKTALKKYQGDIERTRTADKEKSAAIEQRLDALAELLNSQHNRTTQIENKLQSLNEALAALVNEFNQQNTAQLQQAEKAGTQEGLLQALREEVASGQARTEQTLKETEKNLAETRAQLASLQEQKDSDFGQMGLYLGGAALALAILLTIAFAFLNSKSKRAQNYRNNRPNHEL